MLLKPVGYLEHQLRMFDIVSFIVLCLNKLVAKECSQLLINECSQARKRERKTWTFWEFSAGMVQWMELHEDIGF